MAAQAEYPMPTRMTGKKYEKAYAGIVEPMNSAPYAHNFRSCRFSKNFGQVRGSATESPRSSSMRLKIDFASAEVRKPVFSALSGKSRIMNQAAIATTQVRIPSHMNIHCQPRMLAVPSICINPYARMLARPPIPTEKR